MVFPPLTTVFGGKLTAGLRVKGEFRVRGGHRLPFLFSTFSSHVAAQAATYDCDLDGNIEAGASMFATEGEIGQRPIGRCLFFVPWALPRGAWEILASEGQLTADPRRVAPT